MYPVLCFFQTSLGISRALAVSGLQAIRNLEGREMHLAEVVEEQRCSDQQQAKPERDEWLVPAFVRQKLFGEGQGDHGQIEGDVKEDGLLVLFDDAQKRLDVVLLQVSGTAVSCQRLPEL
jgi:hypothetical protein